MARLQTAKKTAARPAKKENKGDKTEAKRNNGNLNHEISQSGKGKGKEVKRDDLKEAILSLGGDDNDYELVKDVDSDVEKLDQTAAAKTDAKLSKDISKFIKGLNLSTAKVSDAESSEETNSTSEDGDIEESDGNEDEMDGVKVNSKSGVQKSEVQTSPPENRKSSSKLLVEPMPQWYTAVSPLPATGSSSISPSSQKVTELQSKAKSLHAEELSQYEKSNDSRKLTASSSDAAFLQRVLTSGTLSDRLSALTLMAQSSPLHNIKALESLKSMSQKKGREESLKALRAIVDWWVGGGAPDRKLKYFIDQPLNHPNVTDSHLLVWFFEDWLKKYFYSILQILETLSLDPLPYIRMQTMSLILTLLREKSEQEQNLLRLLVNKLGDSERPVASRASYHILQLLQAHPSMKGVVVREMASLILRPTRVAPSGNTSSGATHLKFNDGSEKGKVDKAEKKDLQQSHSKYYAIIACNQIMLSQSPGDREVALQLIDLYFELFKEILGQGVEDDVPADDAAEDEVDHSRFAKEKRKREASKSGKGKSKADFHDSEFKELPNSQSKLISALLTGINRALPFAKLGPDNVQFRKHIDTLFLITHKSTFNISLQSLRLILQITVSLTSTPTQTASSSSLSTSITDRYYRALYASLHDARLSSSSKQAMYLNLLLKSLKLDKDINRVKAFVRRFTQLLASGGNGGVEFVAGGLYLLGELFSSTPGLRAALEGHKSNADKEDYDPRKREPKFAHADSSPLWELLPLLYHFHPTIRLHSSQLLSGVPLTASADLTLNTLSHFLDRFVYKNPKKAKPKGVSAMQPAAAALDGTGVRITKGAHDDDENINVESFWNKDVSKIPVDQVFFHKYFTKKNEREKAKSEKARKRKGAEDLDEDEEEEETQSKPVEDGSDVQGEGSEDEEENEIWKAIKASNPEVGAGDNSDLDDEDDDAFNVELSSVDSEGDDGEEAKEGEESGDEEGLSLAEASDAEDLIDLDDELPEGLIDYESDGASDENAEEWVGIEEETSRKRKRPRRDSTGKKKKLRSLPTFASYNDYAKMIEDTPEDNI